MTHVQSFWQRSRFCASWAEAAAKNVARFQKLDFFKKCSKEILRKEILHISAIMSFGLKGFASWVTGKILCNDFCTSNFLFSKLVWTVECRTHLSGSCSRVWCIESCKLMLIVNRRLKRCKMSPPQKRWKKPTPVAAQQPLYSPQLQSSLNFIGFDTPAFIPPLRAD